VAKASPAPKVPSPFPRSTLAVFALSAVTRSDLPSTLKSPMATEYDCAPVVKDCLGWKVPTPAVTSLVAPREMVILPVWP
jgi:hypothetical protein